MQTASFAKQNLQMKFYDLSRSTASNTVNISFMHLIYINECIIYAESNRG